MHACDLSNLFSGASREATEDIQGLPTTIDRAAVGQGEVFAESGRVGPFHYHLVVYQYFSDEDGEPVPAHVEVEGRVTDATDDTTMVSPSPYEALIRTTSRKPVSVSSVNMNPQAARSDRTIRSLFCAALPGMLVGTATMRAEDSEPARICSQSVGIVRMTALLQFGGDSRGQRKCG